MGRFDPSSYQLFVVLIVLCVAVGSIVVYRLRRDVEEESGVVTDDDLLRDFERAYYSGEMDEAEFRRVTDTLKARRAGAGGPQTPPVVPTEPASPSPTEADRAEPSREAEPT